MNLCEIAQVSYFKTSKLGFISDEQNHHYIPEQGIYISKTVSYIKRIMTVNYK